MKTINLFVACPKDSDNLKSLKEDIKKKCRDLNVYFANTIKEEKEDRKIKIIPVTYDAPERREEVCKQIIKHRADIVLFLFDDVYDKYLLDELEFAVERSIKFHKPEPLVYVNKNNDHFTDNDLDKKITEILAEGGWVYEPFYEPVDLWRKVLDKLERYFNQYHSIRRIQRYAKWRYYGLWIGSLLLVVSLILGAIFFRNWKKAESKRLLIVGGGSARAYIEDSIFHKQGSLSTKFWLYAPLPSGDAYRMMAEEVINIQNTDYKSHPYFPIVISAGKAKSDSVFRRTIRPDQFIDKGIVIGMYLGNDYLVAYDGNQAIDDSLIGANSTIKASDLNMIISKQDSLLRVKDTINLISIFTTNNNSGTLNSFRDNGCYNIVSYITICDSVKYGRVFSDIDTLSKCDKWIALGSNYYHPQYTSNVTPLVVHDNNGDTITKPVYIYFMLYKDKNGDKNSPTYILPHATKRFLKSMNMRLTLIDSIQYNKGLKIDTSTILYDNIYHFIKENE